MGDCVCALGHKQLNFGVDVEQFSLVVAQDSTCGDSLVVECCVETL